ncbi:MAG: hypothetical protein K2O52_05630 [Oscillospiraceae bacterium]|nr:hypothetical protein [Oscillospiraceae bacterium]
MQFVVEDKSWNRCARQVRRNRKITRTAENLHMTLLDRWDGTNTVQMSNTAIERELNCCHQSAINAKNRLVELGLVQITERKNPTETTSFIIQPVLPPKRNCKASKPVAEKQSNTQPEPKAKKVTPKKPSEPAKKKYGENGRVRLTDEEFANLVSDFGEEVVRDYIQRADDYSVEHNRWYKNNAETIRKWILEDKEKQKFKSWQSKQETKDKFTDEELQSYLALVEHLEEKLDEPEQSDTNKNQCEEIEPPVRPIGYELTDEEIEAIENLHFETILNNSLHPLYYRTPGELMVLAEQWKKYKKLLL